MLGPLRIMVDDAPVAVPGPKRRAVLALLARAEGRAVAMADITEAVWPQEPPEAARASLHSHISRLRNHLGPAAGRLTATGGGYRLAITSEELDAARARTLLARARQQAGADPAAAAELLRQARGLWRGAILADLTEVAPLGAWAVALAELRREVEDCYLACALDAGESGDLVALAREALAADPLREPAVLLLMRALAATGRASLALREGYEYRRRLTEETGLDPSPALTELERQIARGAAGQRPARPPEDAFHCPATLIGRESELAALHRLVRTERLVTVVGPGGVGKTSLALALRQQLRPAPRALLLASVTDPAAVPYALASALDLRVGQTDVIAACVRLLGAGPQLLLVDNCEHLREAAASLITTLLDRCPQLTVLATSREPLKLAAECQFRLAPLPLPAADASETQVVPSVRVFLSRARRVRPDLHFGAAELRTVGDIVRRLDGMPLAIELAAGRLSSLGLADLHARLDRALDLLGDSGPTTDDRHRTLRATIEWSYQLLAEPAQRLFRYLAVFPGGFDLATAEWVASQLGQSGDPAGTLAQLVDASMVDAELAGAPRYRMLAIVRAFGLDQLSAYHETTAAQARLLEWAVRLVGQIAATEPTGQEAAADVTLRRELPSLREAWRLARRLGRPDVSFELVRSLLVPAAARDLTEVWQWALELAGDPAITSYLWHGAVLGMAATAAWLRGELAEADRLAWQGLAAAGRDEDRWWCLSALAINALSQGDFAAAQERSVQAARIAPRPSENYGIAALAAAYAGDLAQAATFNERLASVATSPTLRALHAYVAGEIDNAAGRPEPAGQHYLRATSLARDAGATFIEGIAALGLVTVRAAAGRFAEALRGYRDLIDYWERTGGWLQQWTTLRNLANLLRSLGWPEPALFLTCAADHAPDAPAAGDRTWPELPGAAAPLPEAIADQVRRKAAAAGRQEVLRIARRAIDGALAARPA